MNNNCVVFKGQKNGIVILLDDNIPFDELKNSFKEKVILAKNFFGESQASVKFKGRDLTESQEEELLSIISKESKLNISYIDDGYETKTDNEKIINFDFMFNPLENMTQYHKGSVRSGQSLTFPGSIVIIGDVNPGAEVIAEGNITILGKLKGLVHAGSSGSRDCFISAYLLKATQLRIADVISYIPNDSIKKTKEKFNPSLVYVEDEKIYVAPLL